MCERLQRHTAGTVVVMRCHEDFSISVYGPYVEGQYEIDLTKQRVPTRGCVTRGELIARLARGRPADRPLAFADHRWSRDGAPAANSCRVVCERYDWCEWLVVVAVYHLNGVHRVRVRLRRTDRQLRGVYSRRIRTSMRRCFGRAVHRLA